MRTKELASLPFLLVGFLFLIGFGVVAWGVHTESSWISTLDMNLIQQFQTGISDGKTSAIKLITEIGNIRVVIVLTILLVIVLFIKRRFAEGLWLGGTILFGAAIATKILKKAFDRDRPEFLQLIEKTTESFPSGHVTGTTVFYGLVGLVAVLLVNSVWKKVVIGFITIAWIGFVMYTRIYLGVHFPTDVIGGFLFGTACILISIGVYLLVQQPLKDILAKFRLRNESDMLRQRDSY
ncbi:phosphatase PAP2 family protein [Ornithinibacillus gellani]|uniref:phosphatase PAP2 family protein n=1 Tax=Ornithinibacillus gellani TaxID=2293253 RepID=UPI000F4A7037|nr:phosphatase PAP2 family protein [Ornithinibacillus gellani]TQS71045.1 phosphatase PAP2 family protein [Ornithinibacillus gellani]